jgi:hypothetical protein
MTEAFIRTEVLSTVLFYYSAVSVLAFGLLKSKYKIIRICAGAVVILQVSSFFINYDNIKTGFYVAVYDYLSRAGQPNPLGIHLNGVDRDYFTAYASCFYMFVITIIALGTVAACVYRIDFPLLFMVTFPFFELGMYWGWEVPSIYIVGLIICWVMILSMQIINQTTNKAGRKNTFAVHERRRTFYFTSKQGKSEFYTVFMKFVCILTTGIFVAAGIFSSLTGFVRTEKMDVLRYRISTGVSNFTLNDLSNAFSDYEGGLDIFSVKSVGGTNGGKLGNTDGISFNGSTALKIKTKRFNYPMYLKGYTGGYYSDNSWSPIEEDFSSFDFTDAFKKAGITPLDLDYLLWNSRELSDDDDKTATMEITVKGASKKFAYAPYGTLYSSGSESSKKMTVYDESYVKAGESKYTVTFCNLNNITLNDWSEVQNKMYEYYSAGLSTNMSYAVDDYTNFVYNNYLTVEQSTELEKAYENIITFYLGESGNYTYSQVYSAIKEYLSDNYTYTLTPGETPSGEDFIDYFLGVQKQGYCTYFATVGTELMRMFGYPARYTEGYIVQPSQFGDTPDSDGYYEIEVKDESAHAWAEVYLDSIGWVPAEFTPGYTYGNPNLTEDDDNSTTTSNGSDTSTVTTSATERQTTVSSGIRSKSTTAVTTKSGSGAKTTQTSKVGGNTTDSTTDESGGDEVSSQQTEEKQPLSPTIKYLIMTVITVVVILLIINLRRIYILRKIHAECRCADLNKRVINIYGYALKYLSLLDIKSSANVSDTQLADILIGQCHEKNIADLDDKLIILTDIAVKAHMSGDEITPDEAAQASEILRFISNEAVLRNLNSTEAFTAKYIHCLY